MYIPVGERRGSWTDHVLSYSSFTGAVSDLPARLLLPAPVPVSLTTPQTGSPFKYLPKVTKFGGWGVKGEARGRGRWVRRST